MITSKHKNKSISYEQLEILAPAGSPEALTAAIRCGADAVYLGGGGFNARRNAHNFDSDALCEAVKLCHSRNVSVHFTLNTLVRQEELSAALDLAEQVCSLGVDALIVQDLGLARRIHDAAPSMPLHASTQLSCHTPAGVRELVDMGFTRVVLAREMSREEIAACAGQGAELEIFVHGALCMCVSGQCLLSAMLGGRSGNRGLCAQPCRLPFMPTRGSTVPTEQDTALSLRDLSLHAYVGELKSLGVCSMKIEGRMKRPEYVAAATTCLVSARDAAAKDIIDYNDTVDPVMLSDLQAVFSRSGFTDGYYTAHRDAAMFGARRREDVVAAAPVLGRLQRLYDKETPRVPVELSLKMYDGQPLMLTARDHEGHCITVCGVVPETAVNRSLDKKRAAAQLAKTGGTPFLATVNCDLEDGLTVPLSALNALRRKVLDKLLEQRSALVPVDFSLVTSKTYTQSTALRLLIREQKPKLVARFARADQVPETFNVDMLILPLNTPQTILQKWVARGPVSVDIPRGLFGKEDTVLQHLKDAAAVGVQAAFCGNIGAIPLARQAGLSLIAGFSMNITNRDALDTLTERGINAAVLSQELTFGQMRFVHSAGIPTGIFAYGRQPLMLMRNCPYKAIQGCDKCGGHGSLTDRKGIQFPLSCVGGCTELLNSMPLYLADMLDKLPVLDFMLLYFTDETPEQAADILRQYKEGGMHPAKFTRGLYRRGVE